ATAAQQLLGGEGQELAAQLLWRADDEGLELVEAPGLGLDYPLASGLQDAQRFSSSPLAWPSELLPSQCFSGRPNRVDGVRLALPTRRPLRTVDFDHPLAAGLQEADQAGAEATDALDRPDPAAVGLLLGQAEKLTIAGR